MPSIFHVPINCVAFGGDTHSKSEIDTIIKAILASVRIFI